MPKPPTKTPTGEEEVPEALKVYKFHKLELDHARRTEENAIGECPFCGKAGKFGAHKERGTFNCFVCGESGNQFTFVRKLWDLSFRNTPSRSYDRLAEESGVIDAETFRDWGVAAHALTGEWCVPGYNHEGKITGLYRYVNLRRKDGSWKETLLPSPGLGHHLFGLGVYEEQKSVIDLCEGWRDGLAWYSVRKASERLEDVNVLAVPGANSFNPKWSRYFAGKVVRIWYDNDHPKTLEDGSLRVQGGPAGVRRVAAILRQSKTPPEKILCDGWDGEAGYNLELESGRDLRDELSNA